MKLYRMILLGLALIGAPMALLAAPSATAADLGLGGLTAPTFRAAADPVNWTGFYVGVTAGGAFSDKGRARASYEDGTAFPGTIASRSGSGIAFGGTLGYNQQIGSFLIGVEGDYSYLGLSSRSRVSYSRETGNTVIPNTYQVDGSIRSQVDAFGTVRARLGYLVTPDLLVYGTGGVAFANVSTRATVSEGITYAGGSIPVASFSGRRSGMTTGFAYGLGAEYKIDQSWSVKAEFVRVQLPASRVFAGNGDGLGYDVRRIKNDFNVVRVGLNYAF